MPFTPCMFCPDMACASSVKDEEHFKENKDDVTFAINNHMSFHEHFMFSCTICQLKSFDAPLFIQHDKLISHFWTFHTMTSDKFLDSTIFPVDCRKAECKICKLKIFCRGAKQLERHLIDCQWEEKDFSKCMILGCRVCGRKFESLHRWEDHFNNQKLCPLINKQPPVPQNHRSEPWIQRDLEKSLHLESKSRAPPFFITRDRGFQSSSMKSYESKVENLNFSWVKSKIGKKYFCDFCRVTRYSQRDYKSHLAGKRHREKEAHEIRNFSECISSSLKSLSKSEVKNLKCSSVESGKKYCRDLCQVISTSQTNNELHLAGKRHKKKLAYKKQIFSSVKSSYKSKGDGENFNCSGFASKISKKYCCELCHLTLSSRIDYESHLEGKRHREKKARCADEQKVRRPKLDPDVANFVERALGTRKKSFNISNSTNVKNCPNWRGLSAGERSFFCDSCQTSFASCRDLQSHFMSETHESQISEKNLPDMFCDICKAGNLCGSSFSQHVRSTDHLDNLHFSSQLESEVNSNSPTHNKFYLCGLCLVQCPTVDSLENHYQGQMHAKFMSEFSTPSSKVGCEICQKFDISVDKFKDHLRSGEHVLVLNQVKGNNLSPDETRFSCSCCSDSFSSPTDLQKHFESVGHLKKIEKLSKNDILSCDICHLTAISSTEFQAHIFSTRHQNWVVKSLDKSIASEDIETRCGFCQIIVPGGSRTFFKHLCESDHSQKAKNLMSIQTGETLETSIDKAGSIKNVGRCPFCCSEIGFGLAFHLCQIHIVNLFRCSSCPTKGGVLGLCQMKDHIAIAHAKQKHVPDKALIQEPLPFQFQKIVHVEKAMPGQAVARKEVPSPVNASGAQQEAPMCEQVHVTSEATVVKVLDLIVDQVRVYQDSDVVENLVSGENSDCRRLVVSAQSDVKREAATVHVLVNQEPEEVEAVSPQSLPADEAVKSIFLPQILFFYLCPLCHKEGAFEQGLFMENWNLAIANSHLFKQHPGQEFNDEKMRIFCRICEKVLNNSIPYHQHDCSKLFQKKFQIDIKCLEKISQLK